VEDPSVDGSRQTFFTITGNTASAARRLKNQKKLAPRARFELATLRLTAECSTIELPGNRQVRSLFYNTMR
jgi:hypothetical protein